MINFVKPSKTAMNRIIYYSILIRNIRLTLLQLRKTMLMIRGLSVSAPHFTDLRDVELNLIHNQLQIQQACKLLIEPLLNGIDFGHKHVDNWSVNMRDIKQGYTELEEIVRYGSKKQSQIYGRKFILLHENFTDSTLGIFYSGELIELQKAIHFIDKIIPKSDKQKGLYDAMVNTTAMAMRYRTSKLLADE